MSSGCTSQLAGCACPVGKRGIASSVLQPFLERDTWTCAGGFAMLFALTVCCAALRVLSSRPDAPSWLRWRDAPPLPPSMRAASRRTLLAWATLSAGAMLALGAFARTARADVWGPCASRGVCVYHQMFCEATRHAAAVRHPANFWSNVPYGVTALGILCLAAHERGARSRRPFQLLDALFGAVLLLHTCASLGWHASNCTNVHWVDIGLMNCTIAFFPLRSAAMALASLAKTTDRAASAPAAVAYLAVCAALVRSALANAPLYHEAFPTGRARLASSSLTAAEVAAYIGLPGLYPLPSLAVSALRRSWGSAPAAALSMLALPLSFMFHFAERFALDVYCEPMSLLQPTAAFHLGTGLAIAAAYVQARSLEQPARAAGRVREVVRLAGGRRFEVLSDGWVVDEDGDVAHGFIEVRRDGRIETFDAASLQRAKERAPKKPA